MGGGDHDGTVDDPGRSAWADARRRSVAGVAERERLDDLDGAVADVDRMAHVNSGSLSSAPGRGRSGATRLFGTLAPRTSTRTSAGRLRVPTTRARSTRRSPGRSDT